MSQDQAVFEIVRKKKGAEILGCLVNGAKCVEELQDTVGGSFRTIYDRLNEFEKLSVIEKVAMNGQIFSPLPHNSRLFKLTMKGQEITTKLNNLGVIRLPLLPKQRQRWILLYLSLFGSIRGATRFEKLLFLHKKEIGLVDGNFYRFKWYHYGPFSKELLQDLQDLSKANIIAIEKKEFEVKSSTAHLDTYSLTSKGHELVSDIMKDFSPPTIKTLRLLKRFNDMPLEKLLEYVYAKYG